MAFQNFRKPFLDFMGNNSPVHQGILEIVNKPRSLTFEGAALKFFQTTFLLLKFAMLYACLPCTMIGSGPTGRQPLC
jgi:hypothetical protein